MRKPMIALVALFATMLGFSASFAQDKPEPDRGAILKTLNFRPGTVTLGENLATLTLTKDFRYLDAADTKKFLEQYWHNPPGTGDGTLGMIIPASEDPKADNDWGVIITYDDSGYVSDEEADTLNYDDLLKDMQEGAAADSAERVKQGYESVELVGWAKKPYYDKAAKKMYWAKRLRFGSQKGEANADTLNYSIRILGRRGVLELNAVAGLNQLATVDKMAQPVLAMVNFDKGNTYAEFDPAADKVAAYGLAGLVAGGVLAKAGFFAKLLAFIIAGKKLVFVVLAVVGGAIAKLWGKLFGKKEEEPRLFPGDDAPPPSS